MSAIAFCVFGTAGDILPCIPVAQSLESRGHVVTFVTPRWLGLYSRLAGYSTISIGDGAEKSALTDLPMYTTRFDGMDSWRRSMVKYVFPLLSRNYDAVLNQIEHLAPDLIITTAQGYWGALAATELGIPWSSFHLYPQLFERHRRRALGDLSTSTYARPLADWLIAQEVRLGLPRSRIPVIDWSVNNTITVSGHDPAVVQFRHENIATLGFPYWDDVFSNAAAVAEAVDFLNASTVPRVVVSLGSFIGLIDSKFWRSMKKTGLENRGRFLFVGLGESDRDLVNGANVRAVSHVPLSTVLPSADLMIHHGGIGSTYAALNAGIPALLFPHAFDQSYNMRLVERLGVGSPLGLDQGTWGDAITRTLEDESIVRRAKQLSSRLVPAAEAANLISQRLSEAWI